MQTKNDNLFHEVQIYYHLAVERLVTQTLERNQGVISETGALVINTGQFTGRSPADKFIVKDSLTADKVDWNKFNHPLSEACFLRLKKDLVCYLDRKTHIWSRDAFACADENFRLKLRVINEEPCHNHFAANMFIAPEETELSDFSPEWTIIQAPGFLATPAVHGTRQGNFTVVSFEHQTILIGGTGYTGEIKKAVFTVLNYLLPLHHQILTMHCSANKGAEGDTALFFGLSGTGKTTLSSDPGRRLIGDDEHGWHEKGVFNLEGGCYAKIFNLSAAQEPDIFNAIRAGALVENTKFIEGTRKIDYGCKVITENTRVSYPLSFIRNCEIPSVSGIPKNLFFLTCDAYGIFPPVSRLDAKQAMYFFISGYTAKISGTEEGVTEPQATFSPCFGAPFLPLHPHYYATLLKSKLERYNTRVWLINTGWTGGAYGTGKRISIAHTRAILTAVFNNLLDEVPYLPHPLFGVAIPQRCPGMPAELLNPWQTWADQLAYQKTAEKLLEKFEENFMIFAAEAT